MRGARLTLRSLQPIECCRPLGAAALSDEEAGATAALFRVVADPARVKIVNLLTRSDGEPVCACEFEPALGLSQPTVSHHLKKLTDAGLLAREQRGKWAYFSLVPEALEHLASLVEIPEVVVSVSTAEELREQVRQRYAQAARSVSEGAGCGCGSGACCTDDSAASAVTST